MSAPMVWTKTPPDREGYWWLRTKSKFEQAVYVRRNTANNEMWANGFGFVKRLDAEWSSCPLPLPEEPT